MLGDLAHNFGTLVGTALGAVESRLPSHASNPSNTTDPPTTSGESDAADPSADGDLLVNSILGATAGWIVKTLLRPRSVSWPRVVVAGIGATVVSDVVGRALEPASQERDRAYEEDPDALLVRLGAGLAMAAGYGAILYPRLPGSPLAKGVTFGVMEIAAAPHGGLVRIATDTPGIKFPLKDLAVPIDEHAGPLASLAFGIALGVLYRPDLHDD